MKLKLLVLVLIAVVLVGLGYYFRADLFSPKEITVPVSGEAIVVATDATYAPMESIDPKGQIVGFDIDLMKEVAKKIGRPVEFKNVVFDSIFTELVNGKADLIISSVAITPERAQKYLFSNPYFNSGQVALTRIESQVKSNKDLVGKIIGAQKGTIIEVEAKKVTSVDKVKSYPDYEGAILDLVAKKLDAVFIDYPPAVNYVINNKELKIAYGPFTQEYYGIVAKKGDRELINAINQALVKIKEEGAIEKLMAKWEIK